MGKDLRGKELGRGISQREDGLYVARYTNKYGKRVQKVLLDLIRFETIQKDVIAILNQSLETRCWEVSIRFIVRRL